MEHGEEDLVDEAGFVGVVEDLRVDDDEVDADAFASCGDCVAVGVGGDDV